MTLFSFRTKGSRRTAGVCRPLTSAPPPWASYDPVFDTVDRIENDYHRFARRQEAFPLYDR